MVEIGGDWWRFCGDFVEILRRFCGGSGWGGGSGGEARAETGGGGGRRSGKYGAQRRMHGRRQSGD